MITNKKTFIKKVKKDFPEFVDDFAIIEEAEKDLMLTVHTVEFLSFIGNKRKIKLYYFKLLKNGKRRFEG